LYIFTFLLIIFNFSAKVYFCTVSVPNSFFENIIEFFIIYSRIW